MQQLQEKPNILGWLDSNPWILRFPHNASASKFEASGNKMVNREFFSIHKEINTRYNVTKEWNDAFFSPILEV